MLLSTGRTGRPISWAVHNKAATAVVMMMIIIVMSVPHKNRQRTGGMDGRVPAVVVRNLHGARTKQQDGAFSNTGGGLSAKAYGERRPPPCPVVLIGRFVQQQRLRCDCFGCFYVGPEHLSKQDSAESILVVVVVVAAVMVLLLLMSRLHVER
jgi:hypothetical protein